MENTYYASSSGYICSRKGPTPMAKGIELEDAQIIANLLNEGEASKRRISILSKMLDDVLIEYSPIPPTNGSAENKIYRIREILAKKSLH